jgi:cytochrome c oxidase subunit 3/cytochrome o ubiquinol oxidase subunit 3
MTTATIALTSEQSTSHPDRGRIGMYCLIAAESAIFTIFVVAYLFYLGQNLSGPTPRQVLRLPILNSICLISSSLTIMLALRALGKGARGTFLLWWAATIALGGYFLFGTGVEWKRLIYSEGLTIQTNLFGTTFYSLVGLHAFHVLIGLVMLLIVLLLGLAGAVKKEQPRALKFCHFIGISWTRSGLLFSPLFM